MIHIGANAHAEQRIMDKPTVTMTVLFREILFIANNLQCKSREHRCAIGMIPANAGIRDVANIEQNSSLFFHLGLNRISSGGVFN